MKLNLLLAVLVGCVSLGWTAVLGGERNSQVSNLRGFVESWKKSNAGEPTLRNSANNQQFSEIVGFVDSWKKLYKAPPSPMVKSRSIVKTEWITQKLDHFDAAETRTFQMVSDKLDYWKILEIGI